VSRIHRDKAKLSNVGNIWNYSHPRAVHPAKYHQVCIHSGKQANSFLRSVLNNCGYMLNNVEAREDHLFALSTKGEVLSEPKRGYMHLVLSFLFPPVPYPESKLDLFDDCNMTIFPLSRF